jgi:hypothetical protein
VGVEKMSISMEAELAAQVRRAAAARGQPVSNWVADTLTRQLRRQELRKLLDEYQAEHGAFTEEELREAGVRMGYIPADPP